ncbi:MAG: hypothetical protein ACOX6P_05195 [Candidatus Merdivicinus sp.]|jgi:ABC-2 type transport system permease protein
MLNYVQAELWRTSKRFWLRFLFGTGILLPILMNILLFFSICETKTAMPAEEIGLFAGIFVPFFGLLALIVITDQVFADENRLHTFSNTIGGGISRLTICWGKFAAILILAFLLLSLMFGSFALSYLIIFSNFVMSPDQLQQLLLPLSQKIAVCFPIWIGILGILLCIFLNSVNSTVLVCAVLFLSGIPTLFFDRLNTPITDFLNWWNPLTKLLILMIEIDVVPYLLECWIVGTTFFVFFTAFGALLFSHREF